MLFKSRRAQRRALLAVALCAGAVGVVPAAAQATGSSNLSLPNVMTRNLYLGADLTPALGALGCTPAPYCTLSANQVIWNQVVATNFPARAKRLAKEIDDSDPYIVALQEVALWRSGPVNFIKDAGTNLPPAGTDSVDYDFLKILTTELANRHLKYKAIVTQEEADIESPSGTYALGYADQRDRRLTMRDVILVRTDLPKSVVSFTNPQSANYDPSHVITLPTGSPAYGGDIVFKRGWASVDVKLFGKPVLRFVDTHLESASTYYRQLQAGELVGSGMTGPLLTTMPAIIAGDLNSDPAIPFTGDYLSSASDGAAIGIIASAGFVDSGNTVNTFGHN
jgi:hypothetical protein